LAENAQASSFEGLLGESRDLVGERLRAAVARMLEKADEALAALTMQTQSKDAQQAYQQTRKVLVSGRQTLEAQFHQLYLAEFLKRTSQFADDAQSFAEFDTSLELVGEDDLEETLRFKELATKLRRYCDEELGALDQRVGVLLGDANLAAERNPFGPETICDAYQQACRALQAETQVRGVLRKLFDDHVIDEVRSVYKDVNALLVRNSILPKIRYSFSKKPDEARKATDKAGGNDAHEGGSADEQSIFSLLQNLVAGQAAGGALRGGAGGGGVALPPGVVVLQGAELLGSLTRLQQGDTSVSRAACRRPRRLAR
jgi:exonuclease VII small subunit